MTKSSQTLCIYQMIAMYSNHKIWCILGLGLSLLFIYLHYLQFIYIIYK